jgi:hypothetical protein
MKKLESLIIKLNKLTSEYPAQFIFGLGFLAGFILGALFF